MEFTRCLLTLPDIDKVCAWCPFIACERGHCCCIFMISHVYSVRPACLTESPLKAQVLKYFHLLGAPSQQEFIKLSRRCSQASSFLEFVSKVPSFFNGNTSHLLFPWVQIPDSLYPRIILCTTQQIGDQLLISAMPMKSVTFSFEKYNVLCPTRLLWTAHHGSAKLAKMKLQKLFLFPMYVAMITCNACN